jgi:hypothetical protein
MIAGIAAFAFAEHGQERLFLPCIKLSAQSVEQFRFVGQEFHERNREALRFNSDAGKPHEPAGDLILLVRCFERFVITLAPCKNRSRQCRERWPGLGSALEPSPR